MRTSSGILNGQVLLVLAAIALFIIIAINIKRTNFFIGILGSILQLALYTLFTLYIVLIIASIFGSSAVRSTCYYGYDDHY